jgi:aspartate racemase
MKVNHVTGNIKQKNEMKVLGLIGGTTWLSTADYYRYINEGVNEKLGGFSSAKIILYSLDFAPVFQNAGTDDWDSNEKIFEDACKKIIKAGAEAIILCANTAHIFADSLAEKLSVPLISVSSETAKQIKKKGLTKTILLGTKFTMEKEFYRAKLAEYGIETFIPCEEDREFIHYTIFNELGKNIFKPETKQRYLEIINKLVLQEAECVILGCTEIPLIISQSDLTIPVLDTTRIHAAAAVDFALS